MRGPNFNVVRVTWLERIPGNKWFTWQRDKAKRLPPCVFTVRLIKIPRIDPVDFCARRLWPSVLSLHLWRQPRRSLIQWTQFKANRRFCFFSHPFSSLDIAVTLLCCFTSGEILDFPRPVVCFSFEGILIDALQTFLLAVAWTVLMFALFTIRRLNL